MSEFGKLTASFLIGALLTALLIDRCGRTPDGGEIIKPADTSSHSVVVIPQEPVNVEPVPVKEVIRYIYKDRWKEWQDSISIIPAVCDSLQKFRTYDLKSGNDKVDITATVRVMGYLDSSRIAWKMNIAEVRIPERKDNLFIGGFAGNTWGGHVAYINKRTMYFIQWDNKKEVRAGVAFGF